MTHTLESFASTGRTYTRNRSGRKILHVVRKERTMKRWIVRKLRALAAEGYALRVHVGFKSYSVGTGPLSTWDYKLCDTRADYAHVRITL